MTPKSQSASQSTRRSFNVPSWAWSLVLLAAAALALAVYHNAQGAPAPNVSANPPAWMIQAQPSRLNVARAASAAWDVPADDAALTNYGQTQHMADYVRQRAAAEARFGQAQESIAQYGLPLAEAPAVVPAVDPAARSVMDFVAKHGLQYASEAPEVVMDAGALSYTDYLRRHGMLPAIFSTGRTIDPQVQALIDRFSLMGLQPSPHRDN